MLKGFIGSSVETLDIARVIQENLERDAEVVIWTDDVFSLSNTALGSLTKQIEECDFCVFVVDAEDSVTSRGETQSAPRDNVVFEAGLAMGSLGPERTFIVKNRDVSLKLPSDWMGFNVADFSTDSRSNLVAALGPACNKIRRSLQNLTERDSGPSWDELLQSISELGRRLRASPARGGYSFDAIIGISRGGICVADILARLFGGNVPVMCLWADRHSDPDQVLFSEKFEELNAATAKGITESGFKNVLLVDDNTFSGATMMSAKDYLTDVCPEIFIKTAVIYASSSTANVDYIVTHVGVSHVTTPFAKIENY